MNSILSPFFLFTSRRHFWSPRNLLSLTFVIMFDADSGRHFHRYIWFPIVFANNRRHVSSPFQTLFLVFSSRHHFSSSLFDNISRVDLSAPFLVASFIAISIAISRRHFLSSSSSTSYHIFSSPFLVAIFVHIPFFTYCYLFSSPFLSPNTCLHLFSTLLVPISDGHFLSSFVHTILRH